MQTDLQAILNEVRRFRDAIEQSEKLRLPVAMRDFPAGACGDAALLLGHHLKKCGFGTFSYVLGMRPADCGSCSHAWIDQDGMIIDITADQFPELNDRIIVSKNSTWHQIFDSEIKHEADFDIYDDRTASPYRGAYRMIKEILDR